MKPLLPLALVALGTLCVIAPVQAQYNRTSANTEIQYRHGGNINNSQDQFRRSGGGGNINNVQAQLQARINQGVASGRLSSQEATKLQNKMTSIAQLEANMRASGNNLNRVERSRLAQKLTRLSADIEREMSDFERRKTGYWSRGNQHNRYGR